MCAFITLLSVKTLYTTTTQRNFLSGGVACHHFILDGSVALPTLHLRFADARRISKSKLCSFEMGNMIFRQPLS